MTFVVYTTIVSPHVVPFVEEVRCQWPGIEVYYISRGLDKPPPVEKVRVKKGWGDLCKLDYAMNAADDWNRTMSLLRECDVLLCGFREMELFEERAKAGKLTYYTGERWLKPYDLVNTTLIRGRLRLHIELPGISRMFVPWFRNMVKRCVRLLESGKFVFLPIGVLAARDIARLRRLVNGDRRCFIKCPEFPIEKRLMSVVDGCEQIRLWGYFVSPSCGLSPSELPAQLAQRQAKDEDNRPLRILWVGRMLECKRVDTIIAAVKGDDHFQLTLLGHGEERNRLWRLAEGAANIVFHDPVDLAGVRKVMHDNDVLVFGSNAQDGWGAVVNEALEEDMKIVGTYEAGSSATILPESNLFHAGDVEGLRNVLLSNKIVRVNHDEWSARYAASEFIKDWSVRFGK